MLSLVTAEVLALAMTTGGGVRVTPSEIVLSRSEWWVDLELSAVEGPAVVRVRTFEWRQGSDGGMELAPSDAVFAYPVRLDIPAEGSRRVRIATRDAVRAIEGTYRIAVEVLAGADEVASLVLIPAFVAPERVDARSRVVIVTQHGERAIWSVENAGTVHVRPAITARVVDAAGAPVSARDYGNWYVLAGTTRTYEADFTGSCPYGATLVVQADTGDSTVEIRRPWSCNGATGAAR